MSPLYLKWHETLLQQTDMNWRVAECNDNLAYLVAQSRKEVADKDDAISNLLSALPSGHPSLKTSHEAVKEIEIALSQYDQQAWEHKDRPGTVRLDTFLYQRMREIEPQQALTTNDHAYAGDPHPQVPQGRDRDDLALGEMRRLQVLLHADEYQKRVDARAAQHEALSSKVERLSETRASNKAQPNAEVVAVKQRLEFAKALEQSNACRNEELAEEEKRQQSLEAKKRDAEEHFAVRINDLSKQLQRTEHRLQQLVPLHATKVRVLQSEIQNLWEQMGTSRNPTSDDEDDDMDGNPRDEDEEALNGDPQAKEDDQIASARGSFERYTESNSDALAQGMGAQASFQGAIPEPPIFFWLSEPRRYAYGSPYAFHACRRATPEKHALPRPPPLTMTGGTLGSANVLGQLAQLDRYKLRTPTRPVLPSSSRKNSRVPDRRRPSSSRYSPYAGSPRQRQDESDSEDGNEFDMRSAGQGSRNKSDQSKRKLKSSATGDASDSDTSATPVEDTTWSRIPSKYASEYPAPGRKYSEAQIKKNINNIVRIYFKKGLGVKFLYQTIVLEPVSEEHLSAFKQDPDTYGPKVDAFALDTLNLPETKHLAASAWNTELERCLTSAIYDRVESINMDGRYGIVDVGLIRKKVHNRMSELYRAIAKARPRADETVQALNKRLNLSHSAYIEHNQAIMARHHKFDRRLRTASLMRAASCEFNRPEATEYWSYVLLVLEALGYDGMSDEESDTEEVTYSGGLKVHSRCRNVLVVKWRHPQLRDLLVEVDDTPKRANQFFSKLVGSKGLRRVRVPQQSPRDPPKKMARALFDPKYLAEIGPANVLALELTDAPIELREGQGSDGDDMPMNVDS
ncbi:hypothetical protein BD626DRAFT_539161 [Schizophyllum amplum]|uniref:Uncharacterized protein n=1 Tax=Schizophyllum amplum TaxID=97359 RepID=A0A550C4I3_9AGAR|nr:hypothetical protein BD626DRAFT_539161 [Auriculariopsis ampla]